MSNDFTLTPTGSAAIGVPLEKPRRPEPEDWLVRECESDPRAAAEEIAILMAAHVRVQDEIKRLNGRIEELQGLAQRSPEATVKPAQTAAQRAKAYRQRKAAARAGDNVKKVRDERALGSHVTLINYVAIMSDVRTGD